MALTLRKTLLIVGLAVVFAVVAIAATSATWVFWDAWKGSDRDAYRALIGSFCGAFFAFVFLRLADALKQLYEKQETNQSRLTQLQHYLNTTLGLTGRNEFVADDFVNLVTEERLASGERPVYMNRFERYPIDAELLIGLTNNDFVNQLYSLNQTLRKLDGSLHTMDRALDQVTEAFITQRIDPASYAENLRRHRTRCIEIRAFLENARDEAVRMFATTRLIAGEPPFFLWLLRILTRRTFPADFATRLEGEIALLNREMEEIGASDERRIAEVQARAAQGVE